MKIFNQFTANIPLGLTFHQQFYSFYQFFFINPPLLYLALNYFLKSVRTYTANEVPHPQVFDAFGF